MTQSALTLSVKTKNPQALTTPGHKFKKIEEVVLPTISISNNVNATSASTFKKRAKKQKKHPPLSNFVPNSAKADAYESKEGIPNTKSKEPAKKTKCIVDFPVPIGYTQASCTYGLTAATHTQGYRNLQNKFFTHIILELAQYGKQRIPKLPPIKCTPAEILQHVYHHLGQKFTIDLLNLFGSALSGTICASQNCSDIDVLCTTTNKEAIQEQFELIKHLIGHFFYTRVYQQNLDRKTRESVDGFWQCSPLEFYQFYLKKPEVKEINDGKKARLHFSFSKRLDLTFDLLYQGIESISYQDRLHGDIRDFIFDRTAPIPLLNSLAEIKKSVECMAYSRFELDAAAKAKCDKHPRRFFEMAKKMSHGIQEIDPESVAITFEGFLASCRDFGSFSHYLNDFLEKHLSNNSISQVLFLLHLRKLCRLLLNDHDLSHHHTLILNHLKIKPNLTNAADDEKISLLIDLWTLTLQTEHQQEGYFLLPDRVEPLLRTVDGSKKELLLLPLGCPKEQFLFLFPQILQLTTEELDQLIELSEQIEPFFFCQKGNNKEEKYNQILITFKSFFSQYPPSVTYALLLPNIQKNRLAHDCFKALSFGNHDSCEGKRVIKTLKTLSQNLKGQHELFPLYFSLLSMEELSKEQLLFLISMLSTLNLSEKELQLLSEKVQNPPTRGFSIKFTSQLAKFIANYHKSSIVTLPQFLQTFERQLIGKKHAAVGNICKLITLFDDPLFTNWAIDFAHKQDLAKDKNQFLERIELLFFALCANHIDLWSEWLTHLQHEKISEKEAEKALICFLQSDHVQTLAEKELFELFLILRKKIGSETLFDAEHLRYVTFLERCLSKMISLETINELYLDLFSLYHSDHTKLKSIFYELLELPSQNQMFDFVQQPKFKKIEDLLLSDELGKERLFGCYSAIIKQSKLKKHELKYFLEKIMQIKGIKTLATKLHLLAIHLCQRYHHLEILAPFLKEFCDQQNHSILEFESFSQELHRQLQKDKQPVEKLIYFVKLFSQRAFSEWALQLSENAPWQDEFIQELVKDWLVTKLEANQVFHYQERVSTNLSTEELFVNLLSRSEEQDQIITAWCKWYANSKTFAKSSAQERKEQIDRLINHYNTMLSVRSKILLELGAELLNAADRDGNSLYQTETGSYVLHLLMKKKYRSQVHKPKVFLYLMHLIRRVYHFNPNLLPDFAYEDSLLLPIFLRGNSDLDEEEISKLKKDFLVVLVQGSPMQHEWALGYWKNEESSGTFNDPSLFQTLLEAIAFHMQLQKEKYFLLKPVSSPFFQKIEEQKGKELDQIPIQFMEKSEFESKPLPAFNPIVLMIMQTISNFTKKLGTKKEWGASIKALTALFHQNESYSKVYFDETIKPIATYFSHSNSEIHENEIVDTFFSPCTHFLIEQAESNQRESGVDEAIGYLYHGIKFYPKNLELRGLITKAAESYAMDHIKKGLSNIEPLVHLCMIECYILRNTFFKGDFERIFEMLCSKLEQKPTLQDYAFQEIVESNWVYLYLCSTHPASANFFESTPYYKTMKDPLFLKSISTNKPFDGFFSHLLRFPTMARVHQRLLRLTQSNFDTIHLVKKFLLTLAKQYPLSPEATIVLSDGAYSFFHNRTFHKNIEKIVAEIHLDIFETFLNTQVDLAGHGDQMHIFYIIFMNNLNAVTSKKIEFNIERYVILLGRAINKYIIANSLQKEPLPRQKIENILTHQGSLTYLMNTYIRDLDPEKFEVKFSIIKNTHQSLQDCFENLNNYTEDSINFMIQHINASVNLLGIIKADQMSWNCDEKQKEQRLHAIDELTTNISQIFEKVYQSAPFPHLLQCLKMAIHKLTPEKRFPLPDEIVFN